MPTMGRERARDDLLPAERKVMERLGHLPLDFRAMAAVSNLFRASTAVRRHMESKVLAADRLSWTSFSTLWVLWIWESMELRDVAAAVGVSRPTMTGVVATLRRRACVRSRRGAEDGRTLFIELTPQGRRMIERLFPRFNLEEGAVTARLAPEEQDALARLLRSLLRTVDGAEGLLADAAPARKNASA
jgi:DNA-binding MarR family transcriptional regulator